MRPWSRRGPGRAARPTARTAAAPAEGLLVRAGPAGVAIRAAPAGPPGVSCPGLPFTPRAGEAAVRDRACGAQALRGVAEPGRTRGASGRGRTARRPRCAV